MKKVKGKTANIVSGIVGILFSIFVFVYAGTFPTTQNFELSLGPSFFPRMLAIGLAIFSVVEILTALKQKLPQDFGNLDFKRPEIKRMFLMLGMIIVFALLIKPIGFVPAGAIFMLVMCKALGMKNKVTWIIVSIVFPLAVALLFQIALKIYLPAGLLSFMLG